MGIRLNTCFGIVFFGATLFFLQSCGGSNAASLSQGEAVEMKYAENITMEDYDGFTYIKIRNPWDTAHLLGSYVLLEKDVEIPSSLSGATIISVPLRKSIVYSSVHNSLIYELGAGDAISGVCDAEYIYQPDLKKRLEAGDIADCGNSMSPDVERILEISPGAVLLSPYENSNGHGKLGHAGIPIVECADYMESSPLATAEWMKFYGRLYGRGSEADSLFAEVEGEYNRLKELCSNANVKPKVILDRVYGQTWSVPSSRSITGTMIKDAGGENPFAGYVSAGALQLSPEKVLYEAGDADIWLIRYSYRPMSLEELGNEKPLYRQFKAYKTGQVYGSDSSKSNIFEDLSFHPHWILADMISLIHPEIIVPDYGKKYYEKLSQ